MKFISFDVEGRPSWGVLTAAGVIDLGARSGGRYRDLVAYIAAGMPEDLLVDPLARDHDLKGIRLAPVIPKPDKIVMAAVNYRPADAGPEPTSVPDYPVLFLRLRASQIAHEQPLVQPHGSEKLDYEGELAVIIGKGGRHIPREAAMSHVAGYSIYNDGSVRDWQKHSHQFTPGKNFVGTGAFGPWMIRASDLPLHEAPATLVTRVNGIEKQRTDTSRMIFDIPYLISYISTFTVLEPRDVIVTGTCTGFGSTRIPPEFLVPGDVVEVEIEGIGVLRNAVTREQALHST